MSPSTYYVVEFWVSPLPDVDKCVCVPDSWLTWIDESNSIAAVFYPGENPVDIEELAPSRSNPNHWLAYIANVQFSASSYEEAMEYLRALRKFKSFAPTYERRFSEELSRQTTLNSGGNVNVNNEAYKQPSLATPYARTPTPSGQIRPQIKMKSPAGTVERSGVSGSQYPVHDDRPSRSLQVSLDSLSTKVPQETSRRMHDTQATRGVSHDYQRPGTSSDHACCTKKLDAIFESMQAKIQNLASEVKRWGTVTDQNVDVIIKIDAWMKADERWNRTNASHLRNRSSMSEMPQNVRNEIISIEDDDGNDDDDDVNPGNSTAPNQVITAEKPRRVQPPEYNPHDSRWTLKYLYPGPTLTELLRGSRVYVDTMNLNYCDTVSRDCKALARMLMVEVFTDRALEVCSLTGTRRTSNCDIPVSPGLDENARNVIIRYAVKCGLERGWCIPNVETIKNSMRDKLKVCRRRVTRVMESEKKK